MPLGNLIFFAKKYLSTKEKVDKKKYKKTRLTYNLQVQNSKLKMLILETFTGKIFRIQNNFVKRIFNRQDVFKKRTL